MISLTECFSKQREVIKENDINDEVGGISFNYDDNYESIDCSKTNTKTFDVGEPVLMVKVAGTMDYNQFVQMDVKMVVT